MEMKKQKQKDYCVNTGWARIKKKKKKTSKEVVLITQGESCWWRRPQLDFEKRREVFCHV